MKIHRHVLQRAINSIFDNAEKTNQKQSKKISSGK
ncbi:hypothetical protein SAMN05444001_11942 [Parabacteroides chinchillae]|uniref:Uncharacterized protein n=1 Tax=Parabacteroides chinchillae TaxID=871327 RepID=A0A8G2F2D7_9BACT|nr:hypothetical protein SAMN05444001_11942 [Parabacteroides chinchillae]